MGMELLIFGAGMAYASLLWAFLNLCSWLAGTYASGGKVPGPGAHRS